MHFRKSVWITGANGMVGRNLLEHELSADWELLTPSREQLDLTDRGAVRHFVQRARPSAVIHCAGRVGGIQANLDDPLSFLLDNVDMARNVLVESMDADVSLMINVGSSCMYPKGRATPLKESDILSGPLEPTNEAYAIAKIYSTKLMSYIATTRPDIRCKTLIPCNLYGRHDNFEERTAHLIPAIINKVFSAKQNDRDEIVIWGDGQARREFLYAADFADAVWKVCKNPEDVPDVMNIGLGFDYSVLDYYRAVEKALDWEGSHVFDMSRPVGMLRKLNCIEKQSSWGWRSQTSLQDGIRKTLDFYVQTLKD